MTNESRDKSLYIGIWNALNDAKGCTNEFKMMYQNMLKRFEFKYDEETLRKWIENQ